MSDTYNINNQNEDFFKKKLDQLLFREEFNGEKYSNRAFLVGLLIATILLTLNLFFSRSFLHSNSFSNFTGLIIWLIYHSVLFFLLRKNLFNNFFKYVTVFVNITGLSVILIGYSVNTSWVHSLRTLSILGYFLIIAASGFYQKPAVTIYAGVMISIQYALLFCYAAFFTGTPVALIETFEKKMLSWDCILYYPSAFIGTSLVVAFISRRMKVLLERSVYSEADALAKHEAKKAIEEASWQKTAFFINLAHETKTPLTLILNYLENYIKKHGLSDELRVIKNSLSKLLRTMVNFIDMEKLERGQFFYDHDQVINFKDTINYKLKLFSGICKNKNLTFNYTDIKEDIYIKIDPFAVDRIINNIIDNAIRYTNPGGSINISFAADDKYVKFIVRDTGSGISKDQMDHIFDEFYQVSHKKRNIQGIGMGLSIVKKVIDEVNGSIKINSELNKGSEFIITFNRQESSGNETILNEVEYSKIIDDFDIVELKDGEYKQGNFNILVVEDNKQMLSYLVNNLQHDYNVFYAENGKRAVKKMNKIPAPQLIISDIMMDEMDGYEFYDVLTEDIRFKSVPFIFLTAKSGTNEKISAIKRGAIDFINKPFLIEELKVRIKSILQVQQQLKIKSEKDLKERMIELMNSSDIEVDNEVKFLKFEEVCRAYKITDREKDVIISLMDGLEYKEISTSLEISINTVRGYIKSIYSKCNVQNKVELVNLFKK